MPGERTGSSPRFRQLKRRTISEFRSASSWRSVRRTNSTSAIRPSRPYGERHDIRSVMIVICGPSGS